ncbi:hypothetical protein [Streptomyces brasiliensis]|uniref:Uncharacterized protein n=1 Tax=Streptomyces brasiliensis TaxID=1954 RepID=A0A917LBI8_9ACTN|nr:hypothetical protein [Streptomyces brasiliensis]GGJ56083.1 hypothetical protein GCM10010121_078340 [Streptomyces brasiliensis]
MGHFLICEEKFVRGNGDGQPRVYAFCVVAPCWEHPQFRVGGPVNWLNTAEWEEGFDLTGADDRCTEINPYGLRERQSALEVAPTRHGPGRAGPGRGRRA